MSTTPSRAAAVTETNWAHHLCDELLPPYTSPLVLAQRTRLERA